MSSLKMIGAAVNRGRYERSVRLSAEIEPCVGSNWPINFLGERYGVYMKRMRRWS
jgi:hypothetical protein